MRKQNSTRKKQGTEEHKSAVDVLNCIIVTFAVFQLERSELNTEADRNAVEANTMVDPIEKVKKRKKNEEIGG